MTKFQDIKAKLEAGAKVIVGLNTYTPADVAKFVAKYGNDESALHYAQVRIYVPGVKYRTNLLAAH